MRKKKGIKILSLILVLMMILAGCGGKEPASETAPLEATNAIPDDGIIAKEQFETVAGKDMDVQFYGETESGIGYTWTFHADQIQNPEDQNLKIDFTREGLDDIKEQANGAVDALKITLHGRGIIAVPTLTITLPGVWESDTGLLLKEQGGKLARISDVTIVTEGEGDTGTTTLTMTINTLDGDCYIVGGVSKVQNNGSDTSNANDNENNESVGSNEDETGDNQESESADEDNNESEAEDVKTEQKSNVCTISIECSTLLDNMDVLPEEKHEFVPTDGLILAPSEVEFDEGESVHDILKRVCKAAGIHMESSYTPVYDSAYIEGINQLYEFDGGELSGWMYKVNGWFPNYGVSKYAVKNGDVIEFVYTCDLGKDVGDNSQY